MLTTFSTLGNAQLPRGVFGQRAAIGRSNPSHPNGNHFTPFGVYPMKLIENIRSRINARKATSYSELIELARADASGKSLKPVDIDRLISGGIDLEKAEEIVAIYSRAESLQRMAADEDRLEKVCAKAIETASLHKTEMYAHLEAMHRKYTESDLALHNAAVELERSQRAKRDLSLLRWSHPELFGVLPVIDDITPQDLSGGVLTIRDPDAPCVVVDSQTFARETGRRLNLAMIAHRRDLNKFSSSWSNWWKEKIGIQPALPAKPNWADIRKNHPDLLRFNPDEIETALVTICGSQPEIAFEAPPSPY